MKFSAIEKRQLLIFSLIAFALPYLLGIAMGIGFYAGSDVSTFPIAQMHYPAAGAMLALLITRKSDPLLPRKFYISFLCLTGIMILCSILSVIFPAFPWNLAVNFMVMLGTVVCWIFYFMDGKQRRTAYGLRLRKPGASNPFVLLVLFIALYFLVNLLSGSLYMLIDPDLAQANQTPFNALNFVVQLLAMPINFFLAFTPFLGEEYGWRGFLQPLLQKRFGSFAGILLLGVAWGFWHLPINIFYYSPQTWPLSVLNQLAVCICYSVFFGFAYIKTKSIWAPVMIHFFNNNSILLFASPDAISNQVLSWTGVLLNFVVLGIVYLPFAAFKSFKNTPAEPLPLHTDDSPCATDSAI